MSPFPTPCKGKSKSQPFAHTFALTGRGRLCTDTQGAALGCGLTALSGRSFSRFVRLSCAHALPLVVWQKTRRVFFWILNTYLPFSPHQTHSNKASDFCRLLSLGAVAAGGVSSSCSESFTGFGLGFGMSNSSVSLYPKERSR